MNSDLLIACRSQHRKIKAGKSILKFKKEKKKRLKTKNNWQKHEGVDACCHTKRKKNRTELSKVIWHYNGKEFTDRMSKGGKQNNTKHIYVNNLEFIYIYIYIYIYIMMLNNLYFLNITCVPFRVECPTFGTSIQKATWILFYIYLC